MLNLRTQKGLKNVGKSLGAQNEILFQGLKCIPTDQ